MRRARSSSSRKAAQGGSTRPRVVPRRSDGDYTFPEAPPPCPRIRLPRISPAPVPPEVPAGTSAARYQQPARFPGAVAVKGPAMATRTSAPFSVLGFLAASALAGCNMDSYASNPNDRETHMGDIHAAAPPPPASATPAAMPPPPLRLPGPPPPPHRLARRRARATREAAASAPSGGADSYLFGCGVVRRYGLTTL